MSGIIGFINWEGAPADPEMLRKMAGQHGLRGRDGSGFWNGENAALGWQLIAMREADLESDARFPHHDADSGLVYTVEARLDDRQELIDALGLGSNEAVSDHVLVRLAHRKWGDRCVTRLQGDWSFAVWDSRKQSLFLARDPYGQTGLRYFGNEQHFVFATGKRAVLAHDAVPKKLNEWRLAQLLIDWPGDMEQTGHEGVFNLPTAHSLTVKSGAIRKERYYRMEDAPENVYRTIEDAADALRESMDRAVASRMSPLGTGSFLSGGMDSGAMSAIAAGLTDRLPTFTSVPAFPTSDLGDESIEVRETAAMHPAIVPQFLDCSDACPASSVKEAITFCFDPLPSVGNFYWFSETLRQAQEMGLTTLLNGDLGNFTASWGGSYRYFSLRQLVARRRWPAIARNVLLRDSILMMRARFTEARTGYKFGNHLIHPDFARRMRVNERLWEERDHPAQKAGERSCRAAMLRNLQPATDMRGQIMEDLASRYGLRSADPYRDLQVVETVLGISPELFVGPKGETRHVMRRAFAGDLSERTLHAQRRKRQALDLADRLFANRDTVDRLIGSMERNPALAEYLDLNNIRGNWAQIQSDQGGVKNQPAASILLKGISCATFLQLITSAHE